MSPSGLTVAELNGDGISDLVVANEGSNDLTILFGKGNGTDWSFVPGPRLKVGTRPVSTTLADVNGDGIQDIFCVNQGSNNVMVLKGLGRGFFDDRNPQVFAAGQGPIQAFVGWFDGGQSPGLVILNSLSSNMTYYAGPISARKIPQTLFTSGTSPVAGVAGDFNKDGFTDLVVANRGSSGLAVFMGGDRGLTLTNIVSLGADNLVTDFAIVPDSTGGFQLFVSTQREGQIIDVSFLPGSAAGIGSSTSPAAFSSGGSLNGGVSEFGSALFLSNSASGRAAFAAQGLTSVQSTAPLDSNTGHAAASVSLVTQALMPLMNAPLSELAGLIDNLVQVRQLQTSDILPLGQSDSALVAVLLSVTRTMDLAPSVVNGHLANEDVAVSQLGNGQETSHISPLDRMLFSPRAPLDLLCSDLTDESQPLGNLGSEWVWSRTDDRVWRRPLLGGRSRKPRPCLTPPPALDGLGREVPAVRNAEQDLGIDLDGVIIPAEKPSGVAATMYPSGFGFAAFSGLLIGAAIWKARSRVVENRTRSLGLSGGTKASSFGRRTSMRDSVLARGRTRWSNDLPPWVTSPTSIELARSGKTRVTNWFGSQFS